MCISRKHIDFLDASNEDDYRAGKVSYETYIRMSDIASRCRQCDRLDNGRQGDILDECRVHYLRLFVSMKRDAEQHIRAKYPARPRTRDADAEHPAVAESTES